MYILRCAFERKGRKEGHANQPGPWRVRRIHLTQILHGEDQTQDSDESSYLDPYLPCFSRPYGVYLVADKLITRLEPFSMICALREGRFGSV